MALSCVERVNICIIAQIHLEPRPHQIHFRNQQSDVSQNDFVHYPFNKLTKVKAELGFYGNIFHPIFLLSAIGPHRFLKRNKMVCMVTNGTYSHLAIKHYMSLSSSANGPLDTKQESDQSTLCTCSSLETCFQRT